jgi:hypothetical protein
MNHHHPHPPEPVLAPSGQATVVLDIGDGIGALVVHTPGDLNGIEIEIAKAGEATQFVHTEVRERVLPEGSVYAGVFADLPDGDYTLLAVAGYGARDVTIQSGRVTEVDLAV